MILKKGTPIELLGRLVNGKELTYSIEAEYDVELDPAGPYFIQLKPHFSYYYVTKPYPIYKNEPIYEMRWNK